MSLVQFTTYPIGAHISKQESLYETLYKGICMGLYSVQFFLGNPKSFKRARITNEDLNRSKKLTDHFPLSVYTHLPYMYNLCGSVKELAWENNNQKLLEVLPEIEHELGVISKFPKNGVVIHPGSYKEDREKGLKTIAKSINHLKFPVNSCLLLENSAGQGTTLGTTLKELKTIIDNLSNSDNIGICIDTCHIHSAGEYKMNDIVDIDRFFAEFDQLLAGRLKLIHLNDSKTPFNSRVDRHELIGHGTIWGKETDSLKYFLTICKNRSVDVVLETHPDDRETIHELFQQ